MKQKQDLRDLITYPGQLQSIIFTGWCGISSSAAVPMNLMKNGVADYIVTGQWAKKAYEEAKKYGKAVKHCIF